MSVHFTYPLYWDISDKAVERIQAYFDKLRDIQPELREVRLIKPTRIEVDYEIVVDARYGIARLRVSWGGGILHDETMPADLSLIYHHNFPKLVHVDEVEVRYHCRFDDDDL